VKRGICRKASRNKNGPIVVARLGPRSDALLVRFKATQKSSKVARVGIEAQFCRSLSIKLKRNCKKSENDGCK
jgi:hypothetical protein